MSAEKNTERAIAAIKDAVDAAFKSGYEKGQADALSAIMDAASNKMGVHLTPVNFPGTSLVLTKAPDKNSRAPRGSVRRAVVKLLESRGSAGATTTEIMNSVNLFSDDVELSGVSASNELHRMKGKLYSQDSKGNWQLLAKSVENKKSADDKTLAGPSADLLGPIPAKGREAVPGGGA